MLPNPVDPESYMVMLVYKNASLTREGSHDSKLPLLPVLKGFV